MIITFDVLTKDHFPLLLKWLETSHVRVWWDSQVIWTSELIEKKYESIIDERSLIKAYIIFVDYIPIGYIQFYNKHDFPREHDYALVLPDSCAAIDWYIGDPDFVGRGIGTKALTIFLNQYVFGAFHNVFVDPDAANTNAIRAYEKAGFNSIAHESNNKTRLMLKHRDMNFQAENISVISAGKRRFKIDKLIRDKMPEILRANDVLVDERVMGQEEYIDRLKAKMLEEANEVIGAKNSDEIKEELADLLEVIYAFALVNHVSFDDVENERLRKKNKKGGFASKIYNSFVELDSKNDNIEYYLNRPKEYPEIR